MNVQEEWVTAGRALSKVAEGGLSGGSLPLCSKDQENAPTQVQTGNDITQAYARAPTSSVCMGTRTHFSSLIPKCSTRNFQQLCEPKDVAATRTPKAMGTGLFSHFID